jgi:hypothetical protein
MRYVKSIASLLRHVLAAALPALGIAVGTFVLCGPAVGASQQNPTTTSVAMPIEGWADFLNEDETAVLDSVYLIGEIHLVVQLWGSGPNNIEQLKIDANLDGVSGTSPTTGQRYRAVGASSVTVTNPILTSAGNLLAALPEQIFTFRLHVVDPEPAHLTSSPVSSSTGMYVDPAPIPVPKICDAINVNGKLIPNYMRCDGIYLIKPDCCTPVTDEGGKVVQWSCPGFTYYKDILNPPTHLANCPAPSRPTLFSLYFAIPFFERFECRGDGCSPHSP